MITNIFMDIRVTPTLKSSCPSPSRSPCLKMYLNKVKLIVEDRLLQYRIHFSIMCSLLCATVWSDSFDGTFASRLDIRLAAT